MGPGWYEDPQNRQVQRWWDGMQWTSNARPKPAGSLVPWLIGGGVALAGLAVLVAMAAAGAGKPREASERRTPKAVARPYKVEVRTSLSRPTIKTGDRTGVLVYVRNVDTRTLEGLTMAVRHNPDRLPVADVVVGEVTQRSPSVTRVKCAYLVAKPGGEERPCGVVFEGRKPGEGSVTFELSAPDGAELVASDGRQVVMPETITVTP